MFDIEFSSENRLLFTWGSSSLTVELKHGGSGAFGETLLTTTLAGERLTDFLMSMTEPTFRRCLALAVQCPKTNVSNKK